MSDRADRSRLLPIALAMALAGLAGCEHAAVEEPPDLEPTMTAVQTQVFNQSCALSGCHVGTSPPMDLNLEQGQAHANLVGVPSVQVPSLQRVAPGDPDASYLVMKVEGAEGIIGGRMPLGIPPLTPQQIQLIRDWIDAGAPDN